MNIKSYTNSYDQHKNKKTICKEKKKEPVKITRVIIKKKHRKRIQT